MKLWMKNMKPILNGLDLKNEPGQSNQLEKIGWKLKAQLSSEAQQKEKIPLTQVQFHTTTDGNSNGDNEPINFEMNHSELYDFYNQLEGIQNELDSLRSSK